MVCNPKFIKKSHGQIPLSFPNTTKNPAVIIVPTKIKSNFVFLITLTNKFNFIAKPYF